MFSVLKACADNSGCIHYGWPEYAGFDNYQSFWLFISFENIIFSWTITCCTIQNNFMSFIIFNIFRAECLVRDCGIRYSWIRNVLLCVLLKLAPDSKQFLGFVNSRCVIGDGRCFTRTKITWLGKVVVKIFVLLLNIDFRLQIIISNCLWGLLRG